MQPRHSPLLPIRLLLGAPHNDRQILNRAVLQQTRWQIRHGCSHQRVQKLMMKLVVVPHKSVKHLFPKWWLIWHQLRFCGSWCGWETGPLEMNVVGSELKCWVPTLRNNYYTRQGSLKMWCYSSRPLRVQYFVYVVWRSEHVMTAIDICSWEYIGLVSSGNLT